MKGEQLAIAVRMEALHLVLTHGYRWRTLAWASAQGGGEIWTDGAVMAAVVGGMVETERRLRRQWHRAGR